MTNLETGPAVKIVPSAQDRRVHVLPESGAICRNPDDSDALDEIRGTCISVSGELRHNFAEMNFIDPAGKLPYSREVTLKRVEAFVRQVIEGVRENHASVIGLVSSTKISLYATGIMLGLMPNDLQPRETHDGSSVLLAASRTPPDDRHRHEIFTQAFNVSGSPSMDGRVGVLFGDEVYAAPGLWRPTNAQRLQSRYAPLASQNQKSHKWMFSNKDPEHEPIGKGDIFGLDHDVRVWSQQNGDDFPTIPEIQKAEPSGLVIKTATLKDPFLDLNKMTLTHINGYGIPTVILNESQDAPFQNPSPVAQKYENLIDGRRLLPDEAQALLAHGLFQANEGVIRGTNIEEIMIFLRAKFSEYPFR